MAVVLVALLTVPCAVFAVSSWSKLRGRAAFVASLEAMRLVPARLVRPVAAAVSGAEAVVAVGLLVGLWHRGVALVALAAAGPLLAVLTAGIVVVLRRGGRALRVLRRRRATAAPRARRPQRTPAARRRRGGCPRRRHRAGRRGDRTRRVRRWRRRAPADPPGRAGRPLRAGPHHIEPEELRWPC